MALNAFLILLLANIYITDASNRSTSTTISRQQKDDSNFGHSGYVYLPSDLTPPVLEFTKCQYYDVNVTSCSFMNKTLRTTQDIILMRAWAAVTLRDNIVTVISYLLHLPNDTFTNNIYSSLNLIYQELQKNNIKVMDLLMRMKLLGKINIISQLSILFKSLHSVAPSYCRSAVDNLSKLFLKKKDRLKNALSTMEGASIDLFTDIRIELIPLLSSKNLPRNFNKKIEAVHGKEYAILFSYILEKKIILSQPVLAVLILNTRFNHLPPQAMEDLRYLTDVLRFNKIKNWKFDSVAKEPYNFIQNVLISLKNVSEVDQVIKNMVKNLLKYLIKPLNTEDQPYYDKMKPFLSSSTLNVPLFFNQLAEDLNIPDALTLKNLIENERIKYPYALKGFIHHYYDSPNKLRLAFLQRIKNRVSIPKHDLQYILNVISFLEQKESQASLEEKETRKRKRSPISFFDSTIPDRKKAFNSSLVICGTSVKYVDEYFSKKSNLMKQNLKEGNNCSYNPPKNSVSSWLQNLNDSDAEPISLIKNISTVLEIFFNDSQILEKVKSLIPGAEELKLTKRTLNIENLNFTYQNLSGENISIKAESSPDLFNETNKDLVKIGINETEYVTPNKITKKDQLIQILKASLGLKNVRARPIVYYEIIRLYCILVHGPNNHSRPYNLEDPNPVNITENFIGNNSLIVSNLLNDTEIIVNLSRIKFDDYPNKQLFLVSVFKKMLTLKKVKEDQVLFDEVARLLRSIIPLPVELDDLTKAIIINSLNDAKYVYTITDFLSQRDTIYNLGDDFDVGSYRTKGSLLYIILQKSFNVSRVKKTSRLNLAIKKMLPRIDCSNIGSEPVTGIEEGATTDMVDFKKLIKNGLDRQNMTPEVTEAFSKMINWHGGTFDPLKYVREINISRLETRAQFFEAFFENLEKNIDKTATEMKKDIELMKSAVKKEGTGIEPVDYL